MRLRSVGSGMMTAGMGYRARRCALGKAETDMVVPGVGVGAGKESVAEMTISRVRKHKPLVLLFYHLALGPDLLLLRPGG